MSRISSATLFNFTDSIDYLIDNLKQGFYCHNTYEKLPLANNGYRVPMACFCDIPLSLIKEHFDWYGRYGLGIKRTYARSQGVQPVWYITSQSHLVRNLVNTNNLSKYEKKYILPFLKQFLGYQYYQKEKREKKKKFYDEREWRYIPHNALIEPFFGEKAQMDKSEAKQDGDRMKIELRHIEYIIIEKDRDFNRLLKDLKDISKKANVTFESLIAKIITAKQIERDF